jgi:hypothetical protein
MGKYVLPTLDSCVMTTTSLDLWMSIFGHNTFILVINFINSQWLCYHVTMGLFEAPDMARITMVMQVKDLLSFYNLLDKIIAYVKDEGGNLSTLARALSYVVNCAPMALVVPWQGSLFGSCFQESMPLCNQ